MKLIRMMHWRCDEVDETTYILAPDDFNEEQIDNDLDEAQESYLKDHETNFKSDPRPSTIYNTVDSCPDTMTVAQVKEAIAQRQKEIQEWHERQKVRSISFSTYLTNRGYKCLWQLEDPDIMEKTVEWGHRHGITINYI